MKRLCDYRKGDKVEVNIKSDEWIEVNVENTISGDNVVVVCSGGTKTRIYICSPVCIRPIDNHELTESK